MAKHFLDPAFVKLFYTRTGLLKPHVMTIPVKPSGGVTPGDEPNLLLHDGTNNTMSFLMSAWVAVLKAVYAPAFTFTHAEFWSMPTQTSDPLFIYDQAIGVVGTGGALANVAVQTVITHRTALGGLYRFYMMENSVAPDVVAYPPFSSAYAAISDSILASGGFIYGRDGGKPTSVISLKTKTNDALRRALITG